MEQLVHRMMLGRCSCTLAIYCKPLIWLHDTDSPVRLTPKFQELLQAVMGYDPDLQKTQDDHVKEELGDVFYNLMAFSLSVQIKAEDPNVGALLVAQQGRAEHRIIWCSRAAGRCRYRSSFSISYNIVL